MGCVEHFHEVWLMYAECDLNVTRAPSVGRSEMAFVPHPVLKNLTSIIIIQQRNLWHQFGRCRRKCSVNRFLGVI